MNPSFKRVRNPSGSSPSSSQEKPLARRVRLLQEKDEEEEEEEHRKTLDENILRLINHNEAILKKYMTYLGDINEARERENRPPLLPFTRWSFNYDKLKEYIQFRAYFYAGLLEEPLQLATIVREINFRIEMAKTKGEKIHLPQDDILKLHYKMYCYSNFGFFVCKDKDQAIYGIPEVRTVIDSIKRGLPYSGNINFEIQVISYFLLTLFTGHINIFRSGRDERGFKITVVIKIPHLKGRGGYFTDAQRVFRRALVSEVSPDFNYDSEVDVVLYICALVDYPSLDAWYYDTNESTLRFRDNVGNIPVFINSSIDEAQERNVPWKSGSAIPFVSNLIRSAGLNMYGSLNSFRKNFAYSINDRLSRTTATTLTEHTINSAIIKNPFLDNLILRLIQPAWYKPEEW
ncbi:hypothetical protein BD770DRAFT_416847 [Pilaira anomala]|nr:hypothetical protein BD770DRAFT_416847 [Pilaira anomala]